MCSASKRGDSVKLEDCVEESDGKVSGRQKEPICYYFQENKMSGNISKILTDIEKIILSASRKFHTNLPPPSQQSMRNLRGYWFETLVKYVSWEVSAKSGKVWAIPMPNSNAMQVWDLFDESVKPVLNTLFKELSQKGIKLTLSNPDILFVESDKTSVKNYSLGTPPTSFDMENLSRIDRAFTELKGKCKFGSFPFGVAIKTELRPDRRYQIIYEGAALKSIMSHLKQRFQDRKYEIKYYGLVNVPVTDADAEVLTNPSIDSLTSIYVEPRKAVDEVAACETVEDMRRRISAWISAV